MNAIQCTQGRAQDVTKEVLKTYPLPKPKGTRIFAAVIANSPWPIFTLKKAEEPCQKALGKRKAHMK